MDDWHAPAPEPYEYAAPDRLVRAAAADPAAVEELAQLLEQAESPALVAGAGADDPETWAALAALAERLAAPVWQEPFGARAGFPQDHPLYAGDLSADRARLREALAGHDVVLVVGAPAFRQYAYAEGPFVEEGTTVALVTEDPGRGAAQPRPARRAGAARVGVRRARRAPAAAGRRAARAEAGSRAALAGRPAARRPRPRRAGAPASGERGRPRGGTVEPARAARPPSRPGRTWA